MSAPDPSSGGLTEADIDLLWSASRWTDTLVAAVERILAAHEAAARRDALLEAADAVDLWAGKHEGISRWLRDRAALDPVTPTEDTP